MSGTEVVSLNRMTSWDGKNVLRVAISRRCRGELYQMIKEIQQLQETSISYAVVLPNCLSIGLSKLFTFPQ